MEMKNKLTMHHKSKNHYILRSFSIGVLTTIGFVAAVVIPTYMSLTRQPEIPSKASDETVEVVETVESENDPLKSVED